MKDLKKLSIIIPIYNCANYIFKCVNSVLNQNYSNIEIILIDDGSTDNSYKECQKIAKCDKRIQVFQKQNEGVSSARNYGLKKSTGDYVLFLDSDDYIEANCLEECMKIILANDIDIVKFGIIKEINKKVAKKQPFTIPTNIIIKKEDYEEQLYNVIFSTNDLCNTTNAIIKKQIIKHNFENYLIGEDFLFFINCLKNSQKVFFIKSYYYHYVVNSSSATHAFDNKKHFQKLLDSIIVNEKIKALLNKNIDLSFINKCSANIESNIIIYILHNNYNQYCEYLDKIKNNTYLKEFIEKNKNLFSKRINKILSGNKYNFYKIKIMNKIKNNIKKIIAKI